MTNTLPRDAEPDEQMWFTAATRGCVSPDLLLPMRAGTLPPEIAMKVETHVSACATCRALLQAIDEMGVLDDGPTADEARRIGGEIERRRPRRSAWGVAIWQPAWLGAAAAAVGAAGLAFLLHGSEATRPLVGAPSHDRELPKDAWVLALQKPGVELPPDALVLRGGGPSPYVEALGAALEPWRWNRLGEAAPKFRDVTHWYPDRPHGFFYLGVSLLMSGDAAGAVAPLERARALAADDPSLRESATWYLAVAFERIGQPALAVQALADLCVSGEARRDDACRGLAALRSPLGQPVSGGREKPSVGAAVIDRDRAAVGATRPGASMPVR